MSNILQSVRWRSPLLSLWWSVFWRHCLLGAMFAVALRIALEGLGPYAREPSMQALIAFLAAIPASYLGLKYGLRANKSRQLQK
jgi:hypothetical protein